MKRLIVAARYWWWRLLGTGGHLPQCRRVSVRFVGRAGGSFPAWECAPGCPAHAREGLASIERWTGHRGR